MSDARTDRLFEMFNGLQTVVAAMAAAQIRSASLKQSALVKAFRECHAELTPDEQANGVGLVLRSFIDLFAPPKPDPSSPPPNRPKWLRAVLEGGRKDDA